MGCDHEYHKANKTAQYDGYGIFLTYTCPKCHADKMAGFRHDVRRRYLADEAIDGDEDWHDMWERDEFGSR